MSADQPRTTVSLVLGSGGARGYAHIGAIEELLARGFDIRSIAGSSMGALIGGIHATGKLDLYRDWVRPLQRLDVWRLLDLTLSGGGFIKGDRIMDAMRELVGEVDIQSLPMAYTAVAVDLDAQREVWFSRGPLFDAIRASIAIPSLLRPFRYQGRLLVDGGLLNPLPVSPTLRDFTDLTIAVDVNGSPQGASEADRPAAEGGTPEMLPADDEGRRRNRYARRIAAFIEAHREHAPGEPPEPGAFDLFGRSLDMVQGTLTRLRLAAQPPDLLISVPRSACAFYEFHRADELIELGRRCTREALARWSGSASRPYLAPRK